MEKGGRLFRVLHGRRLNSPRGCYLPNKLEEMAMETSVCVYQERHRRSSQKAKGCLLVQRGELG
jgi:hypothetical protein